MSQSLRHRSMGYVALGAGIGAAIPMIWMIGGGVSRLLFEALLTFGLLGGVVGMLVAVVDRYFAGSYVATLLGLFCGGVGGIIAWAALHSVTEAAGLPNLSGEKKVVLSNGALWGVLIGGLLGGCAAARESRVTKFE